MRNYWPLICEALEGRELIVQASGGQISDTRIGDVETLSRAVGVPKNDVNMVKIYGHHRMTNLKTMQVKPGSGPRLDMLSWKGATKLMHWPLLKLKLLQGAPKLALTQTKRCPSTAAVSASRAPLILNVCWNYMKIRKSDCVLTKSAMAAPGAAWAPIAATTATKIPLKRESLEYMACYELDCEVLSRVEPVEGSEEYCYYCSPFIRLLRDY